MINIKKVRNFFCTYMEGGEDSILREKRGQIELEWEIPNFLNGDALKSPPFVMGDAAWYLHIYPKRPWNAPIQSISLFLCRKDVTVEHSISYSMAIKANGSMLNRMKGETVFKKTHTADGFRECVMRSAFSDLEQDASWDGAVTVLFSGHLLDGRHQDAASQTCRPEGIENLSTNWNELLLDGRHTDVKLNVQGREFCAHKLVLGARSRVFNAMLYNEMAEKNSGIVDIPDLNPESFQDFLSFVYTGKFDVTPRNALDLYKAADKYDLKDIKKECSLQMASFLAMDNVFDVVILAATHEEEDLLNHATEYFIKNSKEILITENWKTFLVEQFPLANDLLIKMANKL